MELVETLEIDGEEREIADAYAREQCAANAEGIDGINNNLSQLELSDIAGGSNLLNPSYFASKIIEAGGSGNVDEANWDCSTVQSYTDDLFGINYKQNQQYTIIFYGKCKNESNKAVNIKIVYTDGSSSVFTFSESGSNSYCVVKTSENKTVSKLNFAYAYIGTIIYPKKCGIFEGVISESDFEKYIPSVAMLAEDAKAQNDSLEDYGLDNKCVEIVQGSIGSYGNDTEDKNRVKTKDYLYVPNGSIVTVKTSMLISYTVWNESKTSVIYSSEWLSSDIAYEATQNCYVRIKFKKSDDSNFTPSQVGHVGVYINNAIDGLKSDLSAYADGTKAVAKATTAESATKATQDGNGNIIADTYLRKADSTNVLLPIGSMIMCNTEEISQYYGTWVDLGTTTLTCTTGTGEDIMDVTYTTHVFNRTE